MLIKEICVYGEMRVYERGVFMRETLFTRELFVRRRVYSRSDKRCL